MRAETGNDLFSFFGLRGHSSVTSCLVMVITSQ